MKISIEEFDNKYFKLPELRYLSEDLVAAFNDAAFSGETTFDVPDNIDEIINEAKHRDELREKQYNDASALRIAGMTDEQNGDIESAIANYAEAIEVGEASEFDLLHAYHHAYNRIIILLSRTRAYAREAEYIERLLKYNLHDDERERLTARLQNTKAKLEKLK